MYPMRQAKSLFYTVEPYLTKTLHEVKQRIQPYVLP